MGDFQFWWWVVRFGALICGLDLRWMLLQVFGTNLYGGGFCGFCRVEGLGNLLEVEVDCGESGCYGSVGCWKPYFLYAYRSLVNAMYYYR